jgi:hypothetical protein
MPHFHDFSYRAKLSARRWRWPVLIVSLVTLAGILLAKFVRLSEPLPSAIPSTKSVVTANFAEDIAPVLDQYCTKCHGGAKPKGNLSLDKYKDELGVAKDYQTWEKVAHHLRAGEMPPPDSPQPTATERTFLTVWIDTLLTKFTCQGRDNPGTVTVRRLNRAEYNNTIRDLLGLEFSPAADFPADDVGAGFDNIGDVLSVSPLLLEKYLTAAEQIVAHAWSNLAARRRILTSALEGPDQDECAAKALENFAERAYRRPVAPAEVTRFKQLVKDGRSRGLTSEKALQLGVQAILTSPHFIFRIEKEPDSSADGTHLINEFELATRLSYFLWSSMPDEELFRLAKERSLRANLDGQVRRMLSNSKSKALFENFACQWLQIRGLRKATPDPAQFPGFDESLRKAMLKETENFFLAILNEQRSILDFLDSNYTYLNERLARHYGIPGVSGSQFRRVTLTGKRRGGLLTQASILTTTSNPTRTSPVKRGKWILESIFGTPPPPALPNAPQLNESKEAVLASTLRQRMEQHRAKPECASCHQRMDALGFALETYDGIGAWRDCDGSFPIDTLGVLPSGESFNGPAELKQVLLKRKDEFCKCLSEKMLTYAIGRKMNPSDKCFIEKIARSTGEDNYKLSKMVLEVVKSKPFQEREPPRDEE